mmetsp:Transcript_8461/g.12714  ORF Transcript_8461/g.12714 Transcript_8461/m.12714 type:complete len:83 (-) Transcript_8461:2220-2468(-)
MCRMLLADGKKEQSIGLRPSHDNKSTLESSEATYILHSRHVNLFKTHVTPCDEPQSNKVPPNFDQCICFRCEPHIKRLCSMC